MSTELTVGDMTTFKVTCKDKDATIIDLTNATVTFRYRLNGGDSKEITATVTDASAGLAQAQMPAASTVTSVGIYARGELEYEWHILDTGTSDEFTSTAKFTRTIRDRVPAP